MTASIKKIERTTYVIRAALHFILKEIMALYNCNDDEVIMYRKIRRKGKNRMAAMYSYAYMRANINN